MLSRACHRGLRVREPLRIRPMTSLNPVLTIGRQIAEPLRLHQGLRENDRA
jgi:ABC-type microcin C transport system duplicated ATPase subunit YejF